MSTDDQPRTAAERLAARLRARASIVPHVTGATVTAQDSLRAALERLAASLGPDGPAWVADVALTLPGLDQEAAARRAGYVPAAALLARAVDEMPHARTSDPETSQRAASDGPRRLRAGSQLAHLLGIYYAEAALTAEEACDIVWGATEGAVRPTWRRVSDLKTAGLIEPTGETSKGSSGLDVDVLRITAAGRSMHEALQARAAR